MTDIEFYWEEYGSAYGIAHSTCGLYELEKAIIDRGFVITKIAGNYVHFYDPKKAKDVMTCKIGKLEEE